MESASPINERSREREGNRGRRRRGRWALLLALVAAAALWPWLRDAALAALILGELTHPESPGAFTRVTPAPAIHRVRFPGSIRELEANLYLPAWPGRRGGVILVHGVNETGKDDPRVVWLATLLGRAGFVVLSPDFLGFKSLKLRASDIEEMVDAFAFLARGIPEVRPDRIGLIAFSYGAGPTLVASADPRIRDRVRFIVSFGGYYDLADLITFITTGTYILDGRRAFGQPAEYSRWIFLHYNLDLVPDPADRATLEEIAVHKVRDPRVEAGPLAGRLSPGGRAVYELLMNRDPARTPSLIERLPPDIRGQIDRLSPARVLGEVRANLYIVHGQPDDFIPHTESLLLARHAVGARRVRTIISPVFQHVRPAFPDLTWRNFWQVYLPEGLKLWRMIFGLLRERG